MDNTQHSNQNLNTSPQPVTSTPDPVVTPQTLVTAHTGTGFDKEQGPIGPVSEPIRIEEIEKSAEIPFEVQEYIQKTDRHNLELDKPVIVHGHSVVEPARPNITKIELPLSRQGILEGLTRPVSTAIRWMATWCVRIIKKVQGRVVYSDQHHHPEAV